VAEIKGTVLLDTLKAIKARGGDGELARIRASLSEASRKVFESSIQASNWYPLDAFTEFLEVDIRETANGDREVLIKRSEKVIESQLRGIYKIFAAFGSPRFVITGSLPSTPPTSRAYKSFPRWKAKVRLSSMPASANSTKSWNAPLSDFSERPLRFPAPNK
jgi:hypothetical protein